jgi:hypothetical protein
VVATVVQEVGVKPIFIFPGATMNIRNEFVSGEQDWDGAGE